MHANSQEAEVMGNVLDTIFKRTKALAFRMILLNQDYHQDQTARIRHYDVECEGAEMIAHILKTGV